MPVTAIGARLRKICHALPEAREEAMKRGPSYRVGEKIFALERPWNDSAGLWCKVPEGTREIIIGSDPARFFVPPYFGAKGCRMRPGNFPGPSQPDPSRFSHAFAWRLTLAGAVPP